MKLRVADYIAQIMVERGIKNVFSVVGGGAMHLNDAFGNCSDLHVMYNHHEQACALAAEGYARANGMPAAVCVTTGPGGTNAITGVLCAWQDNIPMLIISGQVRYETTVESTGLPLRQFGEQEHYIVDTVKSMTKYAVMIKDPQMIRYHIEKAIYLAMEGRKGPCWLDVPLNIQSMEIETNNQKPYIPPSKQGEAFSVDRVLHMLKNARRPLILAGSGVRMKDTYSQFCAFVKKANIPVLASTSNADILPVEDSLYFGNFGVFGGRPGNFMVQNADCLLVLGCRLSFKQIGFNYQLFAPEAKKIVVDADINELKKNTIHIDIPICADLRSFFDKFLKEDFSIKSDELWIEYCNVLKKRYPIYTTKMCNLEEQGVNPYYFFSRMKKYLSRDAVIIAGNSCACVNLLQMGVEYAGQRLWGNVNCGTMGYDLPAAIGATVATGSEVICVTGDGSIQMNIQELQTIVGNKLPVKIIVFNNNGYHAIIQTQSNFFGRLSGCTSESGITFPDFSKLADAYGLPYILCRKNEEVDYVIEKFMKADGYGLCEVVETANQPIEPKLASKALPGGIMVSPSLSDLAPFLEEAEYKKFSSFGNKEWKE